MSGAYVTERGFIGFATFQAHWHGEVRVQESSIIFESPCVWVFTTRSYSNEPEKNAPSLHLSLEDAKQLRDGLSKFIAVSEESGE